MTTKEAKQIYKSIKKLCELFVYLTNEAESTSTILSDEHIEARDKVLQSIQTLCCKITEVKPKE